MRKHEFLSRQKVPNKIFPFSPKFSIVARVIGFIIATIFIFTGIVVSILNTLGIIPGPWIAIIGILFAGIGLIIAFYTLFVRQMREESL
jgi:hypothetical protein